MKFILILWLSKFIAFVVSRIDKQRGSNYSGKIALRFMPDFVKHFMNIDYNKVLFVSGTNGKSTTTNLIYHTLKHNGKQVASNTEGANMMGGVATTLIKNSTLLGKFKKEYLVLEIDERSFPAIHKYLPARLMGITNLQKDQVQRNGDPDFILRKFKGAITQDMTLYLNSEEPRSSSLSTFAGAARYFSVAANSRTYTNNDFYAVTLPCPVCGHAIEYKQYNLASIGPFQCSKCAHRSSLAPDLLVENVDFENYTFTTGPNTWKVPYNNPFYIYNFAMCIAICKDLGLTPAQIQDAFTVFKNPASHANVYQFRGKEVRYLRGKQENPEALQSQIDIIAADPRKKAVFVGMHCVCDFSPYYSGSFYLFDCTFKSVVQSNVVGYVAFSETVANDIASRLILSGAQEDLVKVMDTDDVQTVFKAMDNYDAEIVYILTNTKHAKEIKNYLREGGSDHE